MEFRLFCAKREKGNKSSKVIFFMSMLIELAFQYTKEIQKMTNKKPSNIMFKGFKLDGYMFFLS